MAITIVNPGGGGSSGGGTLVKTGSYNAAAGDSGQLIVFNVNTGGANQATFQQSNSSTAGALSYTGATQQKSFLVAMGRGFNVTGAVTITDTFSNTWTSVPGFPVSNGTTRDFFLYCQSNKGFGTLQLNAAGTGATGFHWSALEYTGMATPVGVAVAQAIYDGVENSGTGSSATPNSGNITTNNTIDLLLGWCSNETADGLTVTGGTVGWTSRANQNGNVFTYDQTLTATATKNFNPTLSSSVAWMAGIAAFVAQTNVTVNYTLLATPSSSNWFVFLTNESTMSTVTIVPNGALLNGLAANFTLSPGQTCRIFTDGTNYFLN